MVLILIMLLFSFGSEQSFGERFRRRTRGSPQIAEERD